VEDITNNCSSVFYMHSKKVEKRVHSHCSLKVIAKLEKKPKVKRSSEFSPRAHLFFRYIIGCETTPILIDPIRFLRMRICFCS